MAINTISFLQVLARDTTQAQDATSAIKGTDQKSIKDAKSKFTKEANKENDATTAEIAKQEEELIKKQKALEVIEEIKKISHDFEDFYNRESSISKMSYTDTGLNTILTNQNLFDMCSKQGVVTIISLLFSENEKLSEQMSNFIMKFSKINHKLAVQAISESLDGILEYCKTKNTDMSIHQLIVDNLRSLLEKNGYKEIHRYLFLFYQETYNAYASKNDKFLKEMISIMENMDLVNFDKFTNEKVRELCYHYYTFLLRMVSLFYSPNSMLVVSDYFVSLADKYPDGFPKLDTETLKLVSEEAMKAQAQQLLEEQAKQEEAEKAKKTETTKTETTKTETAKAETTKTEVTKSDKTTKTSTDKTSTKTDKASAAKKNTKATKPGKKS